MKNKITFFFRKSREGAFSIENLFLHIQKEFPKDISIHNHYLSRQSSGIINRVLLCLEAYLMQKGIIHITGDINFIALLLNKNRTVLTIHDTESFKRSNSITNFILNYFWVKMPIKRAIKITVVSNQTKENILQQVKKVNPNKIVVIPNVISEEFFYLPKPFNKVQPNILQIGTKYNKNLERTISALKGIDCTFTIVGNLTSEHKALLKENSIDYINRVGLTDAELRKVYQETDLVTFVSTFEGFGIPILEANATGRVVITSNCSSMPEVAGKAAYFVNPYDVNEIRRAYLDVISNDGLREKLISEGLENIKRFKVREVAKMYLDLYQGIW